MVIDLVRYVGSANVCFRINERTCVANFARAIESSRFSTLLFATKHFKTITSSNVDSIAF